MAGQDGVAKAWVVLTPYERMRQLMYRHPTIGSDSPSANNMAFNTPAPTDRTSSGFYEPHPNALILDEGVVKDSYLKLEDVRDRWTRLRSGDRVSPWVVRLLRSARQAEWMDLIDVSRTMEVLPLNAFAERELRLMQRWEKLRPCVANGCGYTQLRDPFLPARPTLNDFR